MFSTALQSAPPALHTNPHDLSFLWVVVAFIAVGILIGYALWEPKEE